MAGLRRDQILLPALVGVLVVVAAVIGVAIWRTRGDDTVTLAPPFGATTSTDPDTEARAAALSAYDSYLRAVVEANRRGEAHYDGLALYTGELLRQSIAQSITDNTTKGIYYMGELKNVETRIDSIDLASQPPVASISACLDATNYRLVFRTDNSPVPGTSTGRRYMAGATASMSSNGRWLIIGTIAHADQTC